MINAHVARALASLGLSLTVVAVSAGCGSIHSAGPATTRPATTHPVAGPAPMTQSVWALPQIDGGILMAAAPPVVQERDRTPAIRLVDISATGSIDSTFGDQGVAEIHLRNVSQSFAVITAATNGRASVLTAIALGARAFQLTQIRG